jgi:hypothetical protein
VEDDFRKTGVKWRIKAMDRTEWRKICEVAKVLQELYSHGVIVVHIQPILQNSNSAKNKCCCSPDRTVSHSLNTVHAFPDAFNLCHFLST